MFILELDATEKDFLLSKLKGERATVGRALTTKLKSVEDVFGVVVWSDDDIRTALKEHGVPSSQTNIEAVRTSYFARHIDDHMVEVGWEVLNEAVVELDT